MANLLNIPVGKNIPDDFNVIIEIPGNSGPVKYELDKDSGLLCVDRFMPTSMHYPCNYGFVPSTLSEDGDPVDVLLLTPFPIQAGCLLRARAIGMLEMTDESGKDAKVVAVPTRKISMQYSDIESLDDLPQIMLDGMVHFFEHYKDLEPNKWVKVVGWQDKNAAAQEIQASAQRFLNQ